MISFCDILLSIQGMLSRNVKVCRRFSPKQVYLPEISLRKPGRIFFIWSLHVSPLLWFLALLPGLGIPVSASVVLLCLMYLMCLVSLVAFLVSLCLFMYLLCLVAEFISFLLMLSPLFTVSMPNASRFGAPGWWQASLQGAHPHSFAAAQCLLRNLAKQIVQIVHNA